MIKLSCAESQKWIRKDKTAAYGRILYLSDLDDPSNYESVPSEEAEKLQDEIEEKSMSEIGRLL